MVKLFLKYPNCPQLQNLKFKNAQPPTTLDFVQWFRSTLTKVANRQPLVDLTGNIEPQLVAILMMMMINYVYFNNLS